MIGMLIQPATKSPITIIKIPAILCNNKPESPSIKFCIHSPKNDAPAPKLIKTKETPNRKITE